MSATGPGAGPGAGAGAASSAGPGGTNPRKFSEKIALHTQRQAEETAAFQEVMMDITSTRLQAQRLRLARSQGPYYGGSLPNVNQIGRNPQDFQGPFPSALESSRSTRHHGLVERVQRDRRFVSPVRPYRNRQVESALYSSAYLSPPAEPSWRRNCSGSLAADQNPLFRLPSTALNRTNSDSALHTSVMNPPPGDPFSAGGRHALTLQSSRRAGQADGESRRMFPYPVPPIEENLLDQGKLLKPWDDKKLPLLASRPKSCEVPGINVFASLEPPSAPPHGVPPPLNTGGSLPDLSSLHFPSPLPTPLDRDEPGGPAPSLSAAGSTGNLASTLTQLGITSASGTAGTGTFHQPGLLASLHSTLSSPSLPSSLSNPNIQSALGSASFCASLSSASMSSASMSSASLHSSLSNPSLGSSPSLSSQSLHSSLSNSSLQSVSSGNPGYGGSASSPGSSSSTSPRRRTQLTPLILPLGGETRRLHPKQFSPTVSPTLSSITQGVPLDTSRLPLDQRLPPYLFSQAPPLAQHQRLQLQNLRNQPHLQQQQNQHFGTQSPGPPGSMKTDGTSEQNIKQEAELQRGVLLQHSNPSVTSDLYNDALLSSLLDEPYLTLQLPAKPCQQFSDHQTDGFSTLSSSTDRNQFPLALQDPGGPHGQGPLDPQDPGGPHGQGPLDPQDPGGLHLLNNQNQNYGGDGRHNVPNIILTGESPPGLSKEIACALSHVPGFQMDPFSLMDPLTLDLLDGDLMLTDPAVEDSFRSDRLQ